MANGSLEVETRNIARQTDTPVLILYLEFSNYKHDHDAKS
jgi:hypothetical protein